MADVPIAEFNVSDGFTPHQINKLNSNFRSLSGKVSSTSATAGEALNKANNSLIFISEIEPGGGGGEGTTNYNNLTNKPQIEGVTLSGNKTFEDPTLLSLTNNEIESMLT